jgi:two-component system cell cycle response regulator CpdR
MAHILIAEDDESMRKFLSQALERAGHRVTSATDGLTALDALDGPEAFDMLLADIVMPGIDGVELAQRASKKRPHLKVMFITGFAAMTLGKANPGQAEARVLSKPFHLNDLIAQVEDMLQTGKA